MSPPDGKKYILVNRKPSRRSISARDFTLPRPYRKPTPGDALRGASRLRVTLLAFSGLLIASLIAALALIAHDNANAPHALEIVRATTASPPTRAASRPRASSVKPPAASAVARQPLPPPQVIAIDSLPRQAVGEDLAELFMGPLPVPDPDVDLIAAILRLSPDRTPPARPVCSGLLLDGGGCATLLP